MNWTKAWGGILLGLALAFLLYFINPFDLEEKAAIVLSLATLMIAWWITEALPMPVVALTPLVLFPLFNVGSIKQVAGGYADTVIFLFMGGFMIGMAIEKWNLHRRIALSIVNITGTSGDKIVLGFIIATGFLSMWLSNTATTMMMFPIALSVISVVQENKNEKVNYRNFAASVMLAIAYASNFGGIATIIGTPPNVAFVGFISERYNYEMQFVDWLIICLPISLLLLGSLYLVSTKILYPNHIKANPQTKLIIKNELHSLGKLSSAEKRVLIIFSLTAGFWIFKDLLNQLGWFKLDDTMIAIAGALALFITPSGMKEKDAKLLVWEDTSKMAWGILLLFGGGIALATALESVGLIEALGKWVAQFSGGGIVLVIVITIISIFISEVMSNIAQVIVFAPVVAGIADALDMNPLLLGIPMTLAASCASMMPMGTPPNAIVFASGHIRLKQMVITGLVMNIISIVLIVLFCWFVIPYLVPSLAK